MKLRDVVLAVVLSAGASSAAAGQRIGGRILEAGSDRPIGAAVVQLIENGRAILVTESDSLGVFELPAPRPGWYALRIERLGYETARTDSLSLAPGEIVDLAIRLGVSAVGLAPLMVVERRRTVPATEFQRRVEDARRSGLGYMITRDELARTGLSRVTDVVARAPLITLRYDGLGKAWPVSMSQGRGCRPAFYLNGSRMTFAGGESVDDYFSPDHLEGIEVYRNPMELPPQFTGSGECGAIVFWTRQGEPSRGGGWRYLVGSAAVIGMMIFFVAN